MHPLPIVDIGEGDFEMIETIRLEDYCTHTTGEWKPSAQRAEEKKPVVFGSFFWLH